jgi:hypothetical protein
VAGVTLEAAGMTTDFTPRPPRWAEALLRISLKWTDRETVSGDLLEEYRESAVPERGSGRADVWYVFQVAGYVWRATWFWAVVFSGAFLARTLYDWLVPTTDFALRSTVSTWCGVSTLFVTSFWGTWRSHSGIAGVLIAIATSQIAALMSVAGATLLLAIWHDPQTQQAIIGSGGLGEVFALPFMMIIPAVIMGAIGGAAGCVSRRLLRSA